MGNNFSVKHGGFSRYSTIVDVAEATLWAKGRCLRIINGTGATAGTTGTWRVHGGSKSGDPSVAIALETRVASTTTGPYTTLTKFNAPSGERASGVLDAAVIVNDELESGVAFNPGNLLFVATDGKVTTSGNGTGSNSPVIGVALSYANSGDPARLLTMFFQCTYSVNN